MWEEYAIKKHIGYSRIELYKMPAEERQWFLKRIEEEADRLKS